MLSMMLVRVIDPPVVPVPVARVESGSGGGNGGTSLDCDVVVAVDEVAPTMGVPAANRFKNCNICRGGDDDVDSIEGGGDSNPFSVVGIAVLSVPTSPAPAAPAAAAGAVVSPLSTVVCARDDAEVMAVRRDAMSLDVMGGPSLPPPLLPLPLPPPTPVPLVSL